MVLADLAHFWPGITAVCTSGPDPEERICQANDLTQKSHFKCYDSVKANTHRLDVIIHHPSKSKHTSYIIQVFYLAQNT